MNKARFSINRIARPDLDIKDFFQTAARLEILNVELRNDLKSHAVSDNFSPRDVRTMAHDLGINILTINAVQKFNLPSNFNSALEEIKRMIELCNEIHCPAIILCPTNDPNIHYSEEENLRNTVHALQKYGSYFKDAAIQAFIEPLGFVISSLRTKKMAISAISASGFDSSVYRLTHDTFHHYLSGETEIFTEHTGLVHISGVIDNLPIEQIQDQHRILVDHRDISHSKQQVMQLEKSRYQGIYSFEPFSLEIQQLPTEIFVKKITDSMNFIGDLE